MKKLFALILSVILVFGCAALAEDAPLAGGWIVAEEPAITEEVLSAFDSAVSELVGCAYEPIAVLSTRVTAGIDYCILIKSTPIYPGANSTLAILIMSVNAEGARVIDILDTDILPSGEALAGGWSVCEDCTISEDIASDFSAACEGLAGVGYTPVAVLGTQVVAGINYRILALSTVVYPGAMPGWSVVTVYAGVDGTREILSAEDLILFPIEEEAEEADGQNPVMNLIGDYQDTISERAVMTVECAGETGAHVHISWANSAFETVEWDIGGEFNTETNTIAYENAVRTLNTYAEDGTETVVIESNECAGTLMVTEDWHILWTDYDAPVNGTICDFVQILAD